MRVVYIDILLLLNFYITYFLIAGTCCFTHIHAGTLRRISGSLAGALSSLVILLPPLPLFVNMLLKLAFSSVIVLLSLGFGGIRCFLKSFGAFFVINCVYAGVMLALWLFSAPMGMVYNNGVSYFELPVLTVIIATAAAYAVLRITRHILDSKAVFDKKYVIEITTEKGAVTLKAMPDSGNKLTDFFTRLPVIFCNFESCSEICPSSLAEILFAEKNDSLKETSNIKGIRIVPCQTVSGSGTAYCFKPKKLIIKTENTEKETDALIGFTKNGLNNGEFDAVFNPNII